MWIDATWIADVSGKNMTSNFFSKMRSNIQEVLKIPRSKRNTEYLQFKLRVLELFYAVIILLLLHCHQNRNQNNGLKIEAYPCNSNLGFNSQLFFLIHERTSPVSNKQIIKYGSLALWKQFYFYLCVICGDEGTKESYVSITYTALHSGLRLHLPHSRKPTRLSWTFLPVQQTQRLALYGISRLAAIRQKQRITESAVVGVWL